ncbi:MAG: iron-siderophore ABC transporter substrate-binding protein [Goleter apudmare HA4340-LM2]|nr:iron-siderophore ABC transporter substrate-binding protein [Goleter apudmare HA4340-LM2]
MHFTKGGLRGVKQRLLLSLLTVAIVSACSSTIVERSKTQTPCRVVQHVRGETCIPVHPQRIVAIYQSSLAHMLALNSKPVAAFMGAVLGKVDYLADKTDGVEMIYGSPLSLEQVVLLNPDLIITLSSGESQVIYNQLSQIAPTVVLPWVETKGNWKQHLQDIAGVLGKTELATQLLDDYDRRIQQLKQVLGIKSAADQKGAASSKENRQQPIQISYLNVSRGQLNYGGKYFANGILDELGLSAPRPTTFGILSEETLPEIAGDILFIATYSESDRSILKQLQQKPLWSQVKAVQQNQVYLVNFSLWYGYNILAAHAVLDEIEKYLVNTP